MYKKNKNYKKKRKQRFTHIVLYITACTRV